MTLSLPLALGILLMTAEPTADELLTLRQAAIRAAGQQAGPSVVRIEAAGSAESLGRRAVSTAPTTGVVLTADGWIAASAYQLAANPAGVIVTSPDGRRFPARVAGTDRVRKIVLLKIDAQGLTPAVALDHPQVGQTAIALGRTWSLDRPSISVGIVSALARVWGKAVQTDAKVSPVNYGGPLIDLQGRVIGVLAPLSPSGGDAAAGVEWYDAGIGFAIPLQAIYARMDQLQKGDLYPGLAGLSFESKDLLGPLRLSGVRWRSPAATAGLRLKDRIVQTAGRPTLTLAEFRNAVGGMYAGDKLDLVVERDSRTIHAVLTLAREIPAYVRPLAGLRAGAKSGVVVEAVLEGSPAQAADMKAGDEILAVDGVPVQTVDQAELAVRNHAPGEKTTIRRRRGGAESETTLTLASFPTQASGEAVRASARPNGKAPSHADAAAPEDYSPDDPHGALVWLVDQAGGDWRKTAEAWKKTLADRDLLLVAVSPRPQKPWELLDLARAKSTLRDVQKKFSVDPRRIALLAGPAGAATAQQWMQEADSPIRGAVLPAGAAATISEGDPARSRLLFLVGAAAQKPTTAQSAERLTKRGHPASFHHVDPRTPWTSDARLIEAIGRWTERLGAF